MYHDPSDDLLAFGFEDITEMTEGQAADYLAGFGDHFEDLEQWESEEVE